MAQEFIFAPAHHDCILRTSDRIFDSFAVLHPGAPEGKIYPHTKRASEFRGENARYGMGVYPQRMGRAYHGISSLKRFGHPLVHYRASKNELHLLLRRLPSPKTPADIRNLFGAHLS